MNSSSHPYIWDSWYLYHPGDDAFHVYYLNVGDHALVPVEQHHFHARIGYAVTGDFVTYTYIDHAVLQATTHNESRDNTSIWTGSSVRYGAEDRQLMAYTSRDAAQGVPEGFAQPFTQHISFATSADGQAWERVSGAHVDADPRFYSASSIPGDVVIHAWRDPVLFRIPGNDYAWMLLCAHGKDLEHGVKGERNGRHGVIALLRSRTPGTLAEWTSTGVSFAVDVPEAEVPRIYIDERTGSHVIAYSCKNAEAYVPKVPDKSRIEYGFYGFAVDMQAIAALVEEKAPDAAHVIRVAESEKIPLLAYGEDHLYACQIVPERGGLIIGFDTDAGVIRASEVRTVPYLKPASTDFSDFGLRTAPVTKQATKPFSGIRKILCIGMPVADVLIDNTQYGGELMRRFGMRPGVRNMLSARQVEDFESALQGIDGVSVVAGGSLANTASAVARLSPQVEITFCAAAATDTYGEIFARAVAASGMRGIPEVRAEGETSRSYVMTDEHGERAVARYLGTSMSGLDPLAIERDIAEADLVLLEGELPALENGYAFWNGVIELAHRHGTAVGFTLFGAEQVRQHRELFLKTAHSHAACVFGNEEELAALFDGNTDDFTRHCETLAARMRSRNPNAVLCISHGRGDPYLSLAGSVYRTAPQPVAQVVNTLGAGDAFMAGVCTGLLHGRAPEACLSLGHRLAAAVIQQEGPQLEAEKLRLLVA